MLAKIAKYKKAIAGFLAGVVGAGGTLLSLGILGQSQSHGLAVVLAFLTPVLTALGVAVAPANE